MVQLRPLEGDASPAPNTIKLNSSTLSVLGSEGPSLDDGPEAAESSGSSGRAGEPPEAPTAAPSAGGDSSEEATVNTPPNEESLAQLRVLGRLLLLGWAEALGALVKLPGVGSMRVEALVARLQELAQEASPVGTAAAAAAAAAVASGEASTSAGPAAAVAAAANASAPPGSVASRGSTPPPLPATELAGPVCHPQQAYSDPVDMFATAAKSAHLSYPELLHAFAASAEGLDDDALADYLFNLAMLCAEPPENELVVRPVLSLPQNSEEQQQYRRRQATGSSAPVDAMLAVMQQQQQQAGGGGPSAARGGSGGGCGSCGDSLTHEAIWQQIRSQQQPLAGGQYGRMSPAGGRSALHHESPARSKSDMIARYQQVIADPQMHGLLRGVVQPHHQQYHPQQQQQYVPPTRASMSPTRNLQGSGSPLAKAVSMPERDLWLTAASLASEAEQKHHEAAAAAAAAASASFSFHPQPPSSSFGHMPQLGSGGSSAGGSGLWSSSAGTGSSMLRSLSDLSY